MYTCTTIYIYIIVHTQNYVNKSFRHTATLMNIKRVQNGVYTQLGDWYMHIYVCLIYGVFPIICMFTAL